jgi:excisionase family DNA binding protein
MDRDPIDRAKRRPHRYTLRQAFEQLAIKRSKGFELLKAGQLAAVRDPGGGHRYITAEELDRFIDACRKRASGS